MLFADCGNPTSKLLEMWRLLASFACLAATATALRPIVTLWTPNHRQLNRIISRRTRCCVSHDGYSQAQPDEYQYHTQQDQNDYTQQGQYGYSQHDQYGHMPQGQYGHTQDDGPNGPVEWWFLGLDNQQNGPVTAEQMSRLYDNGLVGPNTYIWSPQKSSEWLPVSQSAIRYKHGRYDPRSTTQTYEQWLEATGSPKGWPQRPPVPAG